MHEAVFSPEISLRNYTTEQIYCQLLGLKELPKDPESLPQELHIPFEVFGLPNQKLQMLVEAGQEKSWTTFWDSSEGRYAKSRIYTGTENRTSLLHPLAELFSVLTGQKPLVHVHTHPPELHGDFTYFSDADIRIYTTHSRHAYLNAVVSQSGIMLLVATQKSRSISKFSSVVDGVKSERQWRSAYTKTNYQEMADGMRTVANNIGFGWYFCYWHDRTHTDHIFNKL